MQELSVRRRRKVPLLPELQNPVIMVRAAKHRPRLVGLPNITIRAVKVANHQLTTANLPFNHQISRHLNYHPRRPKICLKQPKRPLQKS
jgi:hypothetical protein